MTPYKDSDLGRYGLRFTWIHEMFKMSVLNMSLQIIDLKDVASSPGGRC